MEWTPAKGIYFVTYEGNVKRGTVEVEAEDVYCHDAQV